MRRCFRFPGLLSPALLLLSCLDPNPAEAEVAAEKMITREFKVSPAFICLDSYAPRLRLIQSAKERLEDQGIPFPEGASASFDVLTNMLSVTNTPGNQELVESFCEVLHKQGPHLLVFELTVVEGNGQTIRQLNTETSRSADATPALTALLKDPRARVIGEAVLTTSSGTRATTRSAQEHHFPSGFSLNAQSRLSAGHETVATGLSLELEPTISFDGPVIDLTGSLELNPEPVSDRQMRLPIPGTDTQISLPQPRVAAIRSTFNTSLRHGETRLISIAAPPRMTPRGWSDVLWASFLTVHEVRMHDAPIAKAAVPSKSVKAPAGMQAAAFQVPAGRLENSTAGEQTLQEFFETHGIQPAQGAEAVVEDEVLTVVNNGANIERIAALIHHMNSALPRTVALTLHTVQGNGPYLRSLAAQAAPLADHGTLWAEIERGAAAGEHSLKITNTTRIDFHSDAQQASLAAVQEHKYLASYDQAEETQKVGAGFEVRDVGTTLKFSAETNSSGLTEIALNIASHSLPPQPPIEPAAGGGVNKQALPPATDFQVQETTTQLSFPNGGMRLASLARLHGIGGEDIVLATFLRCDVSAQSAKLQPAPKPLALPRSQNPNVDPKKQYTRSYRVPPDFLSIGATQDDEDAKDVVDPFAADAGKSGLGIRKSAKERLEAAGISFPPGASVHTGGATSQLVVRNTQENLDKVEAYVLQMIEQTRALPVVLTTHIIEAPAPLVRQMMAGLGGRNNHGAELDQLLKLAGEGKASALATSRIETKPGTRSTTDSGVEQVFLSDATEDDQGGLSFATDVRQVGLRHEVELVLHTKNGLTVQPTLGIEFHTAPPVDHDEQIADAEGRLMPFPMTDFHVMKLVTETIIPAGTKRLLAVWKPSGKKDAEAGDVLQAMFVSCEVLRSGK